MSHFMRNYGSVEYKEEVDDVEGTASTYKGAHPEPLRWPRITG